MFDQSLALQDYIPIQKQKAKQLGIEFKDIVVSPRKTKKYRIILKNGKSIDYGAAGYSDFLFHGDEARRQRFHNRFKNNKAYNDPNSALFYSQNLLW